MSGLLGRCAVVVGAGIGGLSVAGALAKYFERVEIFERDRLAASAVSRSGTPQDRHPHGLLAGGLKALDELFPGFESDLATAGAVPVRVAQEIQYERPDVGVLPKRDFGISLLCASRPLIEFVLRRQAEATANIMFRPLCRVTEILSASADEALTAIRFDTEAGRLETLKADLVVDATGRGALTLTLLDALGWEPPEVTEVGVDLSYATIVLPIPTKAPSDLRLVLTLADPPAITLSAVLLPIEDNRWIVSIADRGATAPLQTWDCFIEASRSLMTPTIYNALRYAEPQDSIRHYRFPASLWRHFNCCLACLAACCPSPMRSAGSTQSTARACRSPLSKPACYTMCWAGRLRNRIRSRQRRPGLWRRSPRWCRRPGKCPRLPISHLPGRAAKGRKNWRKLYGSKPLFSSPLSPNRSSIAR
jgi:2-polyprenyl-6-methoxyphenol hydroxylase-like FAD-dependent oxidoreductase